MSLPPSDSNTAPPASPDLRPRRGEVYWANLDPVQGSEQSGRRPVLIVQNDRGNASSPTTVVVAISSSPLPKRYPFTVPLPAGEGGLPRASYVNCAHIRSIDIRRLEARMGSLDDARMQEVATALKFELGLS